MGSITIPVVSIQQMVAMADGLLRAGDHALAQALYQAALAKGPPERDRQRIRTRLGLAKAPTARTAMNLGLLLDLEAGRQANPFVGEGLATWLKTLPFADDARFQELAERHAALLPLANWHWNLSVAVWAVRQAQGVPGDLVELGVFKGHTTLFCAEYVEFQTWPKRWWLYDTFEGIPADQQSPGWAEINKNLYEGAFSHEEVAQRFAHLPNVKVIKGRVPEILLEGDGAPEQIAFIHIDLNNAPAEIGALDTLFDRLSSGGVILFDDYCWGSARVQYEAEKAWFEARDLHILPLPTGQGLFVKR